MAKRTKNTNDDVQNITQKSFVSNIKSLMRKGPDFDYDKMNKIVVICGAHIP